MTRRNWMGFAAMLIAASALALAGCGGDDNGGLSADDMARIDNAEAAAAAAMAAQTAAEAAQAEAEAEAAEAMAAQATAEAAQMAAEAEAMAAKAAQATAEAAQAAAEAAETAAVAAQAVAEAAAMAAQADLTEAQDDLDAAEMAAMAANAAKTAAETALAVAESEARAAKDAQMMAMDAQDKAEAAQMAAETAQKAAEDARDDYKMKLAAAIMERDEYKMKYEEATDVDTTGTLEGAEGRAAAARIVNSVSAVTRTAAQAAVRDAAELVDGQPSAGTGVTPIVGTNYTPNNPTDDTTPYNARSSTGATLMNLGRTGPLAATATPLDNRPEPGSAIPRSVRLTGLTQARLGQPAQLTLAVAGGTGLGTAMDSAAEDAPAIAGWDGVALEKDGPGAITQHALVYSDAERSVRAFGDVYRYNVQSTGAASTSEGNRTHLLINAVTALDSTLGSATSGRADLALFDPNVVLTHGLATDGITRRVLSTANGRSLPGTYAGVAGQFSCVDTGGNNCTVSLDTDGTVLLTASAAGPSLIFRADNAEALLPDADYLAFGVWTEVPDNPTLANPGRVQGFVSGNALVYRYVDIAGLAGSASYSGAAVGHYATRAQGAHTVDMGRFTASASLTANFDADADPYAAGNDAAGLSVTGTISSFMDEDGTAISGWLVNLLPGGMLTRTFDIDGTFTAPNTDQRILARPSTDGDIYGSTSGTTGSLSWGGAWDGWLFGNNRSAHPTGVAGRFQAVAGSPQPTLAPGTGAIDLFNDRGFAGVVGSFAGR